MTLVNSFKMIGLFTAMFLLNGCGSSQLSEDATPIESGEVAPDETPSDGAQPENGEEQGV